MEDQFIQKALEEFDETLGLFPVIRHENLLRTRKLYEQKLQDAMKVGRVRMYNEIYHDAFGDGNKDPLEGSLRIIRMLNGIADTLKNEREEKV